MSVSQYFTIKAKYNDVVLRDMVTGGLGGVRLMAGLNDFKGLFQPK